MAMLIPALSTCLAKMNDGEKRLAHRLEDKLEDDYLCWYDVPVGPQHLHPDFILLHPRRGLLILEVKDWKLEALQGITKTSVTFGHQTDQRKWRIPWNKRGSMRMQSWIPWKRTRH